VDTQRSFTTERNFRAVYAENPRVPAGRAERRENMPAWEKAQFHQPIGEVKGEIQVDQSRSLAAAKFRESTRLAPARGPFETQLHLLSVSYPGNGLSTAVFQVQAAC
jgi:hypothetical protein